MKRVIICLAIIGAIITVGIFALNTINAKNERLYGHIESVIEKYESGADAAEAITELENYFLNDYAPKLGCFIDDKMIGELATAVSRLRPMYESGCDEFRAECEELRTGAKKIYESELPSFFRIL